MQKLLKIETILFNEIIKESESEIVVPLMGRIWGGGMFVGGNAPGGLSHGALSPTIFLALLRCPCQGACGPCGPGGGGWLPSDPVQSN